MNISLFSRPTDSTCRIHFAGSELKIERGSSQYVYDHLGNEYLDCVSNSAHVGHCHPQVVLAGQDQFSKLATTHGFINDSYSKYIIGLLNTLPESLSVIFLVNSGSEANDLAVRLAKQHTKRKDIAVFESCYHGNLTSLVDISSRTFKRLPQGKKDHIHVIPLPKIIPKVENNDITTQTSKSKIFYEQAKNVLDKAQAGGHPIACFVSEMIVSAAGMVVPPETFFQEIYQLIRHRGGLCIADENQTGLGRTGKFWAFEHFNVIPDILCVSKPVGNGYPMGIVATSKKIADSLGDYSNTFGGNPIACCVGSAVLDVIANEKLVNSAKNVGESLIKGLRELIPKYDIIGDVRGMGLCIGVEIVCNRQNMKPASYFANRLLLKLKETQKIIVNTQGEERNIICITPPMCFTQENSRRLIEAFDKCLNGLDLNEEESTAPSTSSSILGMTIPSNVIDGNMNDSVEPPAKRRPQYEDLD